MSPNPLKDEHKITIQSNAKIIDNEVRISMYSVNGLEIPVTIKRVKENFVEFKTDISLASGLYFVNIESNGYFQHFNLRVD